MTPEQRRLRAKIAANARWSQPMARQDQADAARAAIIRRLERQVDPQTASHPESAPSSSVPPDGACRQSSTRRRRARAQARDS